MLIGPRHLNVYKHYGLQPNLSIWNSFTSSFVPDFLCNIWFEIPMQTLEWRMECLNDIKLLLMRFVIILFDHVLLLESVALLFISDWQKWVFIFILSNSFDFGLTEVGLYFEFVKLSNLYKNSIHCQWNGSLILMVAVLGEG